MKILKWIIIAVVGFFAFMLILGAIIVKKEEAQEKAIQAEIEAEQEAARAEQEAAEAELKDKREAFDKSFDDGVTTFREVRNDVTGKWRIYLCATRNNIKDYAVDYYNAYFESDDQIHFIVNFTLRTTTRISKAGNLLDITVHEYVDKEEHDAKALCGGMVLAQTQIDLNGSSDDDIPMIMEEQ